MRHPAVATRSCQSCQEWQYNETDGATGKAGEIAERRGVKLKRVGLPPCKQCVKKSPSQAREYELSPRNQKALNLYYATRAMHGANLTDEQKRDAIVQRNMSLIEQIVKPFEDEQAGIRMSNAVLIAVSSVGPSKGRAK